MNHQENIQFLHNTIGVYQDWPKVGVMFRDVAPLFANPKALRIMSDIFIEHYRQLQIDKIACIDARGFLIASIIAYTLEKPLILVRKQGKLPGHTISQEYALEYGEQVLEIQKDCCQSGEKVALIDDLIATGGSLNAAVQLVEKAGARVVSAAAIIDLPDLGGSQLIEAQGIKVFSLLSY